MDQLNPNGYRTVADLAYAQLRRRILSGELAPGARIDQDAEAERLDVSRMPIREALRRLESEGLVEIVRHRGAQVRPLSVGDLEDLYVLRIELEGAAGRLGTERLDEAGLRRMRQLLPTMEGIVARHEPAAWLDVDWAFHATLYAAAGHPRLLALIRSLREEVGRYRLLGLHQPQELELSLQSHYDIVAAGERRDGAEAERVIQASLSRSRARVRELLEQREEAARSASAATKEVGHGRRRGPQPG